MLKHSWVDKHESVRIMPRFPGDAYVRSFRAADQPAARRLYREGLLAGEVDPNDAAADMEDIAVAYLRRPQDHFWVADAGMRVVGTVALTIDERQVGHLCRLRVAPGWQDSDYIASLLVEAATAHAREHACLMLVLHTRMDDNRAVALLHRLGFQFSRSRDVRGRHLLEFYLNLYYAPRQAVEGRHPLA